MSLGSLTAPPLSLVIILTPATPTLCPDNLWFHLPRLVKQCICFSYPNHALFWQLIILSSVLALYQVYLGFLCVIIIGFWSLFFICKLFALKGCNMFMFVFSMLSQRCWKIKDVWWRNSGRSRFVCMVHIISSYFQNFNEWISGMAREA